MADYHHKINQHHRKRLDKRTKKIATMVLCVALGFFAYIGFDAYRNSKKPKPSATFPSELTYAPKQRLQSSQYFQFQTDDTWSLVGSQTTANKFVYHSLDRSLLVHSLVIYIGKPQEVEYVSRVLPLERNADGYLAVTQISEHCKAAYPAGTPLQKQQVTISKTSMPCNPEDTLFTVLAGISEGNTSLNLARADGTPLSYTILYSDLRSQPDGEQFPKIMTSFKPL